jgi:NTE family protein
MAAVATSRVALTLALSALCALGGCMTAAPLGNALTVPAGAAGYRFSASAPERRRDDLLLILTFSGGGHRAAAMAYGALEQLASDRIAHDGNGSRLLDKVDVISAVSGGSMVGAYYALYGDGLFKDFRRDFLERDVRAALWRSMLLSPINWVRLASPRYARGDMFADYLDRHFFKHHTFGDLAMQPDRPFLVVNATDLSAAGRFEFTQDWFDMICVDLASFPMARAVAASSAYPIFVAPITVQNRAGSCGFQPPAPLMQAQQHALPTREARLAARIRTYQERVAVRYLHLADGAMSDNLGIRTAIDVLLLTRDFQEAQRRLGLAGVRRIAVISVDAAGTVSTSAAQRRRVPSALDTAGLASMVLVEDVTDQNRVVLRELLDQVSAQLPGGAGPPVETYWVDVALADLVDVRRRERLRAIPTSLSVKPKLLVELLCSAHELLVQNVQYQRLLRDLAGSAPVRADCAAPR